MRKKPFKPTYSTIITIASLTGFATLALSVVAQAENTPSSSTGSPSTSNQIYAAPVALQNANDQNPAMSESAQIQNISYDSLRSMAYSGQSQQAIKLAEEYLKYHENSAVRVLLARMLGWNKQFDAAREQLQFVLSKHPGDHDANETLADIEVWTGNYNRAVDVLTNALKYDPGNASFMDKREIIRGKILVSSGHSEQAIQLEQDYLKSHDSNSVRIYLASLLGNNKQYDEARSLLNKVLSQKPDSTDANIALADVEISAGDYKKALDVIQNGLKYSPTNTRLLTYKKLATDKLNSPAASGQNVPSQTVSVLGQPQNAVTYAELNKMAHSGQRKKAIQLAEGYLKQNENSDVRVLLGLMLSWEGKYDQARQQFETVLKKNPQNSDASKGLANVEIWSGHSQKALIVINNALKYHPDDKELIQQKYKAMGSTSGSISYDELRNLAHSNQTEKAKALAREYLSHNDNTDIRVLLGFMETWDKEYEDARVQFETVLKSHPGYSDASLGLANVEYYTDNDYRALQVLNAALKHDPNNQTLLNKRSDIIESINKTIVRPGLFSLFNLAGVVGPATSGEKQNAIQFNQEVSYVDDLKETWKITSLGYERYTPYGPVIFSFNQFDRFKSPGNQVLIEAYPHLFPGAYMYVGYGYSPTTYIARNYLGFEPFFSLPGSFEFSAGERYLEFRGGTTRLYTGSFAKYYGNYWFALRPYYSNSGGHSYYLTARRYFSSPDSYISLTVGGGTGPSNFDLLNPNSISSDRSRSIRLNGDVPLTNDLIFTWLIAYSFDHFPNSNIRQETDVDAGFIWRF